VANLHVSKEYREDLGEQDDEGYRDFEYRYWWYAFEVDGRNYVARIYTDTPEEADVMEADGTRHPEYADDLQTIAAYLRREAAVRTLLTIGANGDFEPTLRLDH